MSLCLLVLLLLPPFRKLSYELFLRIHQALAALFFYSAWRHLPSNKLFPRAYLIISAGLFITTLMIQAIPVIVGLCRFGRSRATITQTQGIVKVKVSLSRPLKVEAGQYINLWMPSTSFWSFLQSHPFTVTSWKDGAQNSLELFIEPRNGLTQKFLRYAKADAASPRLVVFTGPHGKNVPAEQYESVLMVADGFGIGTLLPYLKRLIHSYNVRKSRTNRIHLLWHIKDIGM